MRQVVFHLGAVVGLALSWPMTLLSAQSLSSSLQFDLGSGRIPPESGYTVVVPSSRYSRERSFGLLSDSLTPVEKPRLVKALGSAAADGLAKEGPIDFRVDLPKGRYVIEIVMDGGMLDAWCGEISINGKVIASSLESFGYSAESTYAPPYWACLRRFDTDVDHATVRVCARGQRTILNSISIYPYTEGPITFADGVFVQNHSACAPNFDLALKLINSGKVAEASRIIDAIPSDWNIDRAHLLLALASRIETQSPRLCVESAYATLLSEYSRSQNPALRLHLRLAELYLKADQHYRQAGWQWARDLNGMGIFGNCEISGTSSSEIASIQGHPLWPAAVWHLARTRYWLWIEQHVDRMVIRADSLLTILQRIYPGNDLIKEYLGDPGRQTSDGPQTSATPRWAQIENHLSNRLRGIIHYWCENRQGSNGEFGGKYDDDVEMLRWWPFACVAMDDSLALHGMKRLVDGIWSSDWIANGWCRSVRDVEHSSEPVADTQPMMIGFDYGNPVYVERCMQSVKLALELWTARNSSGHRHFRSSWYSSTEVDTTEPKDCDVPYNTRSVKAIRWFAWYTRHPSAMRFLREWADAWLDDCLKTEKGKPGGIVPAAVRFFDDAVGGHADNWHHPGMFWNYYDYSGGSDMLLEFLSCYQLFGEPKYLKPIELSLELVQKHAEGETNSGIVGSEAWAASTLRTSGEFWVVVEIWRLLTGDNRFDALLSKHGSPYLQYRLSSDESAIERLLSEVDQEVDRNYSLLTTEAYFTDRVVIRDLRGRDKNGASLLESMYLGAPLASLYYPFSAVFWKNTDSTFSALVEESSPTSIRVRAYNHSTVQKQVSAAFLQLEPGEYDIVQRTCGNGDGTIERVSKQETWQVTHPIASHTFILAPRTEECIVVHQRQAQKLQEQATCDLAITEAELRVTRLSDSEVALTLPVHNIGTTDATDILVNLSYGGERPVLLKQVSVRRINAPLDLSPRQEVVSFRLPNRAGRYSISATTGHNDPEITRANNTIEFVL